MVVSVQHRHTRGAHSFGVLVSDRLPGFRITAGQFRHSGSQLRDAGLSVSGGDVGSFSPILALLGLKLTME